MQGLASKTAFPRCLLSFNYACRHRICVKSCTETSVKGIVGSRRRIVVPRKRAKGDSEGAELKGKRESGGLRAAVSC